MKLRKTFSLALALSASFLLNPAVQATEAVENYPSKPVQFIVPYAPGGPLDAAARLLSDKVQETDFGQRIFVDNKAGAGGNIGIDTMIRSGKDGYTIAMGAVATMAINPWLYSNIPFDASKDIAPVLLVSNVPNVLVLNKEFADANNINDLPGLFEYMKANPGKLNYASGGNGSAGHLAGELLKNKLVVSMVHVPYQGANPAKLSLLANETQLMFDNLASAQTLIESGKVKALAVTTAKRSKFLPDVSTLQEAGVDDFDIGTWFGIVAPAGTPEPIITKLNAVYTQAMKDPKVQEQLRAMGSDLEPGSAQDFAEFAKKEYDKYKEIVELSNARID